LDNFQQIDIDIRTVYTCVAGSIPAWATIYSF